MSKICNMCNTQMDDNVAFCPNCGNNVPTMNNGMNNVQGVQPDLGLGVFNSYTEQSPQMGPAMSPDNMNVQNDGRPDLGLGNFNTNINQPQMNSFQPQNNGMNYNNGMQQPMMQPQQPQDNYMNVNQMQGYPQQPVNNFNQGMQYQQPMNNMVNNAPMNTYNGGNNQGYYSNNAGNFISNVKNNKNMLYGIIGGVIGLIVIIVLFINFGDGGYNAIKGYMSGMKSFNAKKVAKYTHEELIEKAYDDFDDYVDVLEEEFEDMKEKDYKVLSYEIDKDYDEYDDDELEDFAEKMDYMGIDEDSITEVREYSVKIKVSADGEKDTTRDEIVVYKSDGKWYIYG